VDRAIVAGSAAIIWIGLLADPSVGYPILACPHATAKQQARTDHLEVYYPEGEEDGLSEFLEYAEDVYAYVDSLMKGALPSPIRVTLVATGLSGPSSDGIVLSLEQERYIEPVFARELARLGGRAIVGDVFDAEGYRFFVEGLAAWAGEHFERRLGSIEPRWLWAAYAFMEEATYLEYLEVYTRAAEDLGKNVVNAAGYSLVSYLVDRYGWDGVMSILAAMPENIEVCSAMDEAGFDCLGIWEGWQLALEAESAKHDFTQLPEVFADLEVSGEGNTRDAGLRVFIRNPETTSYLFFVAYVVGDEPAEESYSADGHDFEALVPLGRLPVGTKVLWEVAVWSRTVQAWRKSGWQDRTIR
jgi:hypothetical protein